VRHHQFATDQLAGLIVAQIADLFSWADFLNRPNPGAAIIEDARSVVTATIRG
jgi:hypothetical protein